VIKGIAEVAGGLEWDRRLYQAAAATRQVPLLAIPYYAWDNRAPGAMKVWLPVAPPIPVAGGPETKAAVTVSFAHSSSQPYGINDGVVPGASNERPPCLCHWWPHRGTEEWAQYTWKKPVLLGRARVYWLDDSGRGASRLPSAWQIQYLDGEAWKPVDAKGGYVIAGDRWCDVTFAPINTAAIRLVVKLQKDWAAGVHEWKLVEADDD
jgi:hypothetical protein